MSSSFLIFLIFAKILRAGIPFFFTIIFTNERFPAYSVSSSVQFSRSVLSDSATPCNAACQPPCPSPTPRIYSDSCLLSRRCHPTISSSVIPFSSHLQSFPASGSFQMSQFFASGGQIIGVSASASVLPMNIQD